jgi:hypothetical protein
MTLKVESPSVYTSEGVPISVTGIAQVYNDINFEVHIILNILLK